MIKGRIEDLQPEHRDEQYGYEFTEYPLLPPDAARHCNVSFYRLPPKRANYPYHYHLDQEETFYIISGEGVVKTPRGETPVKTGDLLFFPSGEEGAHRLTNTSDTEELIYIDFDTMARHDVAVYPDSKKIGVWSGTVNAVFRIGDQTRYYDGEENSLTR